MLETLIEIEKVTNIFGDLTVHKDLDLTIKRSEIIAIVGGSGSGKSTLMRSILMLLKPTAGTIRVFGKDVYRCSSKEALQIKHHWGVLFQKGALFSSFTVLENVMFPLREFSVLSPEDCRELAILKLLQVGLKLEDIDKYPTQLSGGMIKRAALARAIALEPELLFLDEPTAGLDPNSAKKLDELVLHLRDSLGLTIVIITHDVNTLKRSTDTIAFLGEGKVMANLPFEQLRQQKASEIQDYFSGIIAQAS